MNRVVGKNTAKNIVHLIDTLQSTFDDDSHLNFALNLDPDSKVKGTAFPKSPLLLQEGQDKINPAFLTFRETPPSPKK